MPVKMIWLGVPVLLVMAGVVLWYLFSSAGGGDSTQQHH
jgi:hypothetical protein